MASDTVTLTLDGDPTLAVLTDALSGLRTLLEGLTEEVADSLHIPWVVSDLERGSARATFTGRTEDLAALHAVTGAYLDVGQALAAGQRPTRSRRVLDGADQILKLIDSAVPAVTFETADDEATVRARSDPFPLPDMTLGGPPAPAFGAVRGRVQTLSNRGGLRFTLYDQVQDRAVSCYLGRGQEDLMRNAWGELVTVEGWIRRDPVSNLPRSVRQIVHVTIEPDSTPGSWRRARGALQPVEPAEVTIRRLRDA